MAKYSIFGILIIQILRLTQIVSAEERNRKNLNFLGITNFRNKTEKCSKREKQTYLKFFPVLSAKLTSEGDFQEFETNCFDKVVVRVEQFNKKKLIITLQTYGKEWYHIFCVEAFLFGTSRFLDVKMVYFNTVNKYKYSIDDSLYYEIKVNGLFLMTFCEGLFTSLQSLYNTALLFIGGMGIDPNTLNPITNSHITEKMEFHNLKLIKEIDGYEYKLRANGNNILDLDYSLIKTGDLVLITRFDGVDQLILMGTGSMAGHSAVCFWIDSELYVLESQAALYWPFLNIQKTKMSDWIKYAYNADYHVAILPLREDIRKNLNYEKSLDFFKKLEGTPYGFQTFLFSFVDTPNSNWPILLEHEILISFLGAFDRLLPEITMMFIGEALNNRLGTTNLRFSEIISQAAQTKGMTFFELMSQPERDEYQYSTGKAYVCSSFVTGFFKAGGLFGDMEIQATEFHPRDLYSLNFYNMESPLFEDCKRKNSDNVKFCQIMGKYQLEFPHVNTVNPYPHMNENCTSKSPKFERLPEGC